VSFRESVKDAEKSCTGWRFLKTKHNTIVVRRRGKEGVSLGSYERVMEKRKKQENIYWETHCKKQTNVFSVQRGGSNSKKEKGWRESIFKVNKSICRAPMHVPFSVLPSPSTVERHIAKGRVIIALC